MNLIWIPQYPCQARYSEWFFTLFPEKLSKYFNKVITLGFAWQNAYNSVKSQGDFLPINASIEFEHVQIHEYLQLKNVENSILLLGDLSFPGFFPHVLFHRKPKKIFAICHGTSINKFDYFSVLSKQKFQIESSIAELCDGVFVATNYHKEKLGWENTYVTAMPEPPFIEEFARKNDKKVIDIICPCRPIEQKIDKDIEIHVEEKLNVKILHQCLPTFKEYYNTLSKSKILLSTAKEETFGYQILDACVNNCIPIAPNMLAYPELLPKEFLYSSKEEAVEKINFFLKSNISAPKLLNQNLISSFFENIANIMLQS